MKRIVCFMLSAICILTLISRPISFAEDKNDIGFGNIIVEGATSDTTDEGSHFDRREAMFESDLTTFNTDLNNPSLAVTGHFVWYVRDGMLLCVDLQTGEDEAAFPISLFCRAGESAEYASVIPYDNSYILLCLCLRSETKEAKVELLKLSEDDNEIKEETRKDITEYLGFLFDGSKRWNEVSIVNCGHRLYIEALNSSFDMYMYQYDLETDNVDLLGTKSLMEYLAGVPYGSDILLVSPNLEDPDRLELNKLSLTDGSTEFISSIVITAAQDASNFAYSETEGSLYFTLNNTVYTTVPGDDEQATAIASLSGVPLMNRIGVLACERYVVRGESGELLSCNLRKREEVIKLHIADTQEEEAVIKASRNFGVNNPDYAVSVSRDCSEEDVLQTMMQHSADYDVGVVRMKSTVFKALRDGDYLEDLSECERLTEAVADMPERVCSELLKNGRCVAFPISVMNTSQILNINALQEVTGLSKEKIPTNWPDFLKLLRKMANKGTLINNKRYTLAEEGTSAELFRETMFCWFLQDCLLWIDQDSSRIDQLQKTLLPILEEFNRVDWTRLGLPLEEDMEENYAIQGSAIPILTEGQPEIVVMDMVDGEEFWPFSIRDGEPRLIPQQISVIFVNSYSPNREAAKKFSELVWENLDVEVKMSLCQSMNNKELNTEYNEDLAYFQNLIISYELDLEAEKDPIKKEILKDQLEQLRKFTEDYQKNAYWLTTEDSITAYRSMENQMVVLGEELVLWGLSEENTAEIEFLTGELSPKEYVKHLTALKAA